MKYRQAAAAGERKRQPSGRIRKVGSVVVRVDGPRRGEEEEERDRCAGRRARAVEQARQRPEADRDLRERHE